ncbi:M1-specific T cell receptor beta chain-like [Lycodopsis pacificus]
MLLPLVICAVSLLCTAGVTWTSGVQQIPSLLVDRGHSAQMDCSHTLVPYHHMYWFRQLPGESMKLIVHMVPYKQPDFGNFSQDKYSASKTVIESGSFTHPDPDLDPNPDPDLHRFPSKTRRALCSFAAARFGAGTKLTVLDPNRAVTPPAVKVLQPSPNECQNNKDKRKKKTLVCVASRFYPHHVSVFWQVDGVNVMDGVSTDSAPLWGGEHYSLTSRLRVPLSEWFTPGKEFTCTVGFFNGNETVHRSNWVEGVSGPGAAAIREKYLRITHTAKLSYVVLIVKGGVFGVFVGFMVWGLQVSSGKQDD